MYLGEGINAMCLQQLLADNLSTLLCSLEAGAKWASKGRVSLTARWWSGRAQLYLLWFVYKQVEQEIQITLNFHFAFPTQERIEQLIDLNIPYCQ